MNTLKKLSLINVLVFMALASGCSSMSTHFQEEFGHPYSGTQSALSSSPCTLAVSGTIFFLPAPFIVADIPLSFVSDTVLLPWDIMANPKKQREEVIYSFSDCMDGMSGEDSNPGDNAESSS